MNGESIEYLGGYTKSNNNILVQCNYCGKIYTRKANSTINSNHGCKYCGGAKSLNLLPTDTICKRVNNITNGTVEFIGKYKGLTEIGDFHCKLCGEYWSEPVINLLSRGTHNCIVKERVKEPKEGTKRREEKYIKRIERINEGRITYIGGFTTIKHSIVTYKCNLCGKIQTISAYRLLHNNLHCRFCKNGRMSKQLSHPLDRMLKELDAVHHGNITYVSGYKNKITECKFRCSICGHIWDAKPTMLIAKRYGCPKCKEINSITPLAVMKNNLYDAHLGRITYVSGYSKMDSMATFKCEDCGSIFDATPKGLIHRKQGCRICSQSNGEKYVMSWLEDNIGRESFDIQKRFKGLKGVGGGNLSYDFYIPSLNLCIEYQGEQHYRPVKFYSGQDSKKNFKKQQEHDRRKRQYCIDNDIKLLEIKYTEFGNINNILKENILFTNN